MAKYNNVQNIEIVGALLCGSIESDGEQEIIAHVAKYFNILKELDKQGKEPGMREHLDAAAKIS